MKDSAKKTLVLAARLLLVGAILFWIFSRIDTTRMWRLISGADLGWLLAAVGLFLLNRCLATVKWGLLLRENGIRESWPSLLRITFVSGFVGSMLPAGIGPDVVRLLQVGKRQGNYSEVAGCAIADRLMATVVLCLVSLAGVLASLRLDIAAQQLYVVAISALLLIAGAVFFFSRKSLLLFSFINKTTARLTAALPFGARAGSFFHRIEDKAQKTHAALAGPLLNRGLTSLVIMLNLMVQVVRVLQIHFLFLALSAEVTLVVELALVPIIILITMLPLSPFLGIGIKEGAFVYFFASVGIAAEISVSASLLSHVVTIAGLLPGGLLLIISKEKLKGRTD